MTYHAGWNFPGCLPEIPPTCFKEEKAALDFLQYEARSVANEFYNLHEVGCMPDEGNYDSCDCEEYQRYIRAWGLSAAIQDGDFRAGDVYQIGHYVYWVEELNECECEDVYLAPVW